LTVDEVHSDPHFALAFSRIENHYFVNKGFLQDQQLLRDAGKLHGIPGVIVQGRYDMACPTKTAWELHKAWPQAKFQLVNDAGHAFKEPGILDRLIRATDAFS
jgi:proline iminopeptidase